MVDSQEILEFWFKDLKAKDWWKKDPELDAHIRTRFLTVHKSAVCGECFSWRQSARGRLAEVIVLDQFSRNMFRDQAESFAHDGMALVLAQEAVAAGHDRLLTAVEKSFLYVPYMHSESLLIHAEALRLYQQPGLEDNYKFELKHRAILERFGRYPHRNAILGRVSTAEEVDFLKQAGSSF